MTSSSIIKQLKAPLYQPQMPESNQWNLLTVKKWQPTHLELITRTNCLSNDRIISNKDKERISKKQHDTLNTGDQSQNWLEEMSKTSKRLKKDDSSQSSYVKLSSTEVNMLEESFEMNNYPSTEEMQKLAEKLGVSASKVENWFKHHRRSLAKKGKFDMKTKKYFRENELEILLDVFKKTSRPSQQQMCFLAKQLNCTEYQIKNWYSNKRKRVRIQARNQGNKFTIEENQFCPSSGSQNLPVESIGGPDRSNATINAEPTQPDSMKSFKAIQVESSISLKNLHVNSTPLEFDNHYIQAQSPFTHPLFNLAGAAHQNNFPNLVQLERAKLIAHNSHCAFLQNNFSPQTQTVFPHLSLQNFNSLSPAYQVFASKASTYCSLIQNPETLFNLSLTGARNISMQ